MTEKSGRLVMLKCLLNTNDNVVALLSRLTLALVGDESQN